jgi:hypothetical protein
MMSQSKRSIIFNCTDVEKRKMENDFLHRQLQEKDQKIEQKDDQLKEVTRFWDGFTNTTCTFNLRKAASQNLTVEWSTLHDMHIATLLDIKAMLSDIDHLTLESNLKIKAIGAYIHIMLSLLSPQTKILWTVGTMVQRKNLGSMIAALNVIHTMGSTPMDRIRINLGLS